MFEELNILPTALTRHVGGGALGEFTSQSQSYVVFHSNAARGPAVYTTHPPVEMNTSKI